MQHARMSTISILRPKKDPTKIYGNGFAKLSALVSIVKRTVKTKVVSDEETQQSQLN